MGFCKIGSSLHLGHGSDSGVVRNAKNDGDFLRRIEMIGFDLKATDASFPALCIVAGSYGQLMVDVMPNLRKIKLTPRIQIRTCDGIGYT